MFGADFVLFSFAGSILVVRLLWLAGIRTRQSVRRNERESVVREALRIVESYEAHLRQ